MIKYLQSEWMKQKRSFNKKIIWLAPAIAIALAMLLMGAGWVQTASYNWWYVLFLPFTLCYVSSTMVSREKKYNYHGLFAITENKKKIWYTKIMVSTLFLVLTCIIFCIATIISGIVFNEQISIAENIQASLLLIITFAWQIPLFMLITLKCNMFIPIVLSVFCSLILACICAVESYWWIPFAIPARVMCPVIRVLPNGLLMEAGNPLADAGVIKIGLLITIGLYILTAVVSARVFEKCEV